MSAEQRVRQALAVTMPEDQVDELVEELRREVLGNYGSPLLGGVALPDVDPAHERREAWRKQLQAGITPFAHAVGFVTCPSENCPAGRIPVFRPNKGGRVPMHRGEYTGEACDGVGARPGLLRLAEEGAE